MTDTTQAMSDAPFGAACAEVPTTGEGSVNGMADDPVATAASNNPLLSTLVSAVTAANLGDTLNSADNITVFAPANSAFEAIDQATLNAAMADPSGLLTTVLTYHVVPGRTDPGGPGRRARDARRRDADGHRFRRGLHGQRRQRRVRQRADGERDGLRHRRRAVAAVGRLTAGAQPQLRTGVFGAAYGSARHAGSG